MLDNEGLYRTESPPEVGFLISADKEGGGSTLKTIIRLLNRFG